MSYARFGENSDVYVFLSVAGHLECCSCALVLRAKGGGSSFLASTTAGMLEHLEAHRLAGDEVDEGTLDGLKAEAEENDAWIAGGGHGDPVDRYA